MIIALWRIVSTSRLYWICHHLLQYERNSADWNLAGKNSIHQQCKNHVREVLILGWTLHHRNLLILVWTQWILGFCGSQFPNHTSKVSMTSFPLPLLLSSVQLLQALTSQGFRQMVPWLMKKCIIMGSICEHVLPVNFQPFLGLRMWAFAIWVNCDDFRPSNQVFLSNLRNRRLHMI